MDIIYRFDPYAPLEYKAPKTNRAALKQLSRGNARFAAIVENLQARAAGEVSGKATIIPFNPISLGVPLLSGLEPVHSPFAMVLGCSDARVPVEQILDCSANDLFVVRVAGNVFGSECLGSIDYAASNLRSSIRSAVVLGHTGCGAITAAVDAYLAPSEFASIALSHAIRTLIDRITWAVRGSARALTITFGPEIKQDPRYREWLIGTSVYMNAALTAYDVQREVNLVTQGLVASYTVYDVALARISALPLLASEQVRETPAFLPAPKSIQDFSRIAQDVIARLIPTLGGSPAPALPE